MWFGYFDYLIIALLVFLNIKFWKTKIKWLRFIFFGGLLFGLLLPVISMAIELEMVESTKGGWIDSFEVWYTFMRFPTYWIIGFLQFVLLLIYYNIMDNSTSKPKPAGNNI
ncbi:hypothetical protein BH23BAC3_BH23BAC3_23970 [soil metagenome]